MSEPTSDEVLRLLAEGRMIYPSEGCEPIAEGPMEVSSGADGGARLIEFDLRKIAQELLDAREYPWVVDGVGLVAEARREFTEAAYKSCLLNLGAGAGSDEGAHAAEVCAAAFRALLADEQARDD